MTHTPEQIQNARKVVGQIVADYAGANRIQELTLDLLNSLVEAKTGYTVKKQAISTHLAKLQISLRDMKTLAKETRVRQILADTTYPIASNEIRSILLAEKFDAGRSSTCALIARIREETGKHSGNVNAEWEMDVLKTQIAEAVQHIETHLMVKVTPRKIAHYLAEHHDTTLSDYIITKVQKILEAEKNGS